MICIVLSKLDELIGATHLQQHLENNKQYESVITIPSVSLKEL